jgi:ABC-type multidrug transport system ATPase subunit
MGPSGAGKSTFMNIISGRYKSNSTIKVNGNVKLNNVQLDKTDFFRISSYVQQEDRLLETHTVMESVEFSTMMTTKGTKEMKKEKAKLMIKEMGLNRCENTLIGGNFVKGLSGGEKKRTSIANELVSEPRVIFLDEPTTGLDS